MANETTTTPAVRAWEAFYASNEHVTERDELPFVAGYEAAVAAGPKGTAFALLRAALAGYDKAATEANAQMVIEMVRLALDGTKVSEHLEKAADAAKAAEAKAPVNAPYKPVLGEVVRVTAIAPFDHDEGILEEGDIGQVTDTGPCDGADTEEEDARWIMCELDLAERTWCRVEPYLPRIGDRVRVVELAPFDTNPQLTVGQTGATHNTTLVPERDHQGWIFLKLDSSEGEGTFCRAVPKEEAGA